PSNPRFASDAAAMLAQAITAEVTETLTSASILDPTQVQALLPVFVKSFSGMFVGDEVPADAATLDVAAALAGTNTEAGQLYASVLLSLHQDASPADNDAVLNLGRAK
ncbi:MAG TPA: hypothetical protein VKP30_32720, partial [Polyangiaceae bacterium]|nr:hypothetical protein [Polyangiaceae bacterium]